MVPASKLLHQLDELNCLLPEMASLEFGHSRMTGDELAGTRERVETNMVTDVTP